MLTFCTFWTTVQMFPIKTFPQIMFPVFLFLFLAEHDAEMRRKWRSRKTKMSKYLQLLYSNRLQNFVETWNLDLKINMLKVSYRMIISKKRGLWGSHWMSKRNINIYLIWIIERFRYIFRVKKRHRSRIGAGHSIRNITVS